MNANHPLWPRRGLPLEVQIAALADCGIHLKSGVSVDALLSKWPRKSYEERPFELALSVLGGEDCTAPNVWPLSDDIWYQDTECIYDPPADYERVIHRLNTLSMHELPLEVVSSFVDDDCVRVVASLDGTELQFDALLDNDWLDTRIFEWYSFLLFRRGSRRRVAIGTPPAEDLLIGCFTWEQTRLLQKTTGLRFGMVDGMARL